MTRKELLQEIKARLLEVHGHRLRGIVLYGSEARGEGQAESDIDVLVLLEAPVHYGEDLETNLRALYPLALEIGRRISAKPIASDEYDEVVCPLYERAHEEGIPA